MGGGETFGVSIEQDLCFMKGDYWADVLKIWGLFRDIHRVNVVLNGVFIIRLKPVWEREGLKESDFYHFLVWGRGVCGCQLSLFFLCLKMISKQF